MNTKKNTEEGTQEYIVKLHPNTNIEEIAASCGFEIKKQLKIGKKKNYFLLKKNPNVKQNMNKLKSLVDYVEENKVVKYQKKNKNL
ncbi:hypothetical protein M0813_17606 [Anaeramoeba flamelloides]|uniref:Uncharacterized protein n=1 Tax=Anaeramoeba flamelloides TaxID=1746091 RepID=A0ABQ8YV50_9EUKA|nr:hypothetical protein M0813_17606 [Anaeramoeba flamelloides]